MVKRVRRLVQGNGQIARICAQPHNPGEQTAPASMTAALWQEWSTSKKLQHIFKQCGTDPAMDVDDTLHRICEIKQIDQSTITSNLRDCLLHIKAVNNVIKTVKAYSSEPFNSENPEHEAKLQSLWQYLLPDEEREGGRFTRAWGKIGFQQADPASDFRGGGTLGLDQLIYIASNRTQVARRMISEPASESSRYPWACVGINITMEAIRVLESRKLDSALYGKTMEQSMEIFNSFYADMFEILHARWIEAKPENILSFPPVLKAVIAEVDHQLSETGVLVPPGAEA